MAHFEFRGKKWRAVVKRKGAKTRSKTFARRADAETWARQVEHEFDTGFVGLSSEQAKWTLADALQAYIDEEAPTKKGYAKEIYRCERFIDTLEFADCKIGDITPEMISAWRDLRLKTVSAQSVGREMNQLSSVFTWIIKAKHFKLRINPVYLVLRPKGYKGKPRNKRWLEKDVQRFLTACNWNQDALPHWKKDYVPWAVLIAIETAMRLSELCAVSIGDIDLEKRYLVVQDSKNGESRDVPLTRRAAELIGLLIAGRPATAKLIPMAPNTLSTYAREVKTAAGMQAWRFHDTRHEGTTRLSKKYSNVLELSAVTGHKSLENLRRYYNPTPEELVSRLD